MDCYIYKDEVSPIAQNKQMSYCVLSTCVQGVCIILNLTTNYHANYNDRGLQNIPVFLALECLFCRLQVTPRMQKKTWVNFNL